MRPNRHNCIRSYNQIGTIALGFAEFCKFQFAPHVRDGTYVPSSPEYSPTSPSYSFSQTVPKQNPSEKRASRLRRSYLGPRGCSGNPKSRARGRGKSGLPPDDEFLLEEGGVEHACG